MHDQRPDFTYVGSARELGLDAKYETAPRVASIHLPETTLGALAADVQQRVGARALRVVGDPNARVSRIQLGVGYATPAVNSPEIDVVISGEQQEVDGFLDSPEYVLDAASLGIPKGWIMLGHAVSEEAGMLEMAQWIKASSRSAGTARQGRRAVLGAQVRRAENRKHPRRTQRKRAPWA